MTSTPAVPDARLAAMQIIAAVRWRPLEIDTIPEPGKSTIARFAQDFSDIALHS